MKMTHPNRPNDPPYTIELWILGSCLKTGQHFIFVIIYLLLPIKYIIFDSVSKILFNFLLTIIIMILIMNILLHNVYEIINLRYPTYVYQFFFIFLIITKIECWPVFKQDPITELERSTVQLTVDLAYKVLLSMRRQLPSKIPIQFKDNCDLSVEGQSVWDNIVVTQNGLQL